MQIAADGLSCAEKPQLQGTGAFLQKYILLSHLAYLECQQYMCTCHLLISLTFDKLLPSPTPALKSFLYVIFMATTLFYEICLSKF